MEGFVVFIVAFVLILAVFAIAYIVGLSRAKKKATRLLPLGKKN